MDGLRRFLVHALMYLDDVDPVFADNVLVSQSRGGKRQYRRNIAAESEEAALVPARDVLLLSYLARLAFLASRSLWHVATPCSSLLSPLGSLVGFQSSFLFM